MRTLHKAAEMMAAGSFLCMRYDKMLGVMACEGLGLIGGTSSMHVFGRGVTRDLASHSSFNTMKSAKSCQKWRLASQKNASQDVQSCIPMPLDSSQVSRNQSS